MRIHSPKELGLLIRQRRRARRLTQGALAHQIGASRFWVLAAEAGKPSAEVGLIMKALGALDIVLDAKLGTATASADIDAIIQAARTRGVRDKR